MQTHHVDGKLNAIHVFVKYKHDAQQMDSV